MPVCAKIARRYSFVTLLQMILNIPLGVDVRAVQVKRLANALDIAREVGRTYERCRHRRIECHNASILLRVQDTRRRDVLHQDMRGAHSNCSNAIHSWAEVEKLTRLHNLH